MAEPGDETPSKLVPCSICSRTFKYESLEKHYKACVKNANKKRKIFDSSKQRIQGTDLAEFLPVIKAKPQPEKEVKKPQSQWKEKHLEFVRAIRAARGIEDPNSKASTSIRPSNHEKCPHCERQFGPKAFDRHIEWCKEQKARIPKSPASTQAKARLQARTKYRAPPLAKSKRTLTREKYAPPSHQTSQELSSSSKRNTDTSSSPAPNQHQSQAPTTMPTIKGIRSQGTRNSTKTSVSTPSCNIQRAASQSFHQRSLSPTKRMNTSGRNMHRKPGISKVKDECEEGKEDLFSVACNITKLDRLANLHIASGKKSMEQNSRHKLPRVMRGNFTPDIPNVMMVFNGAVGPDDKYDPYVSAERQMLELLSHGDSHEESVHPARSSVCSAPVTHAVTRPALETSSQSAFARYTNFQHAANSSDEALPSSFIEDLEDLIISGHSDNPILSTENFVNCENNNSTNVFTSLGLNFSNNNNDFGERSRKPSKIRTKMENASLSLQQSVSILNYDSCELKMGTEAQNDSLQKSNSSATLTYPNSFSLSSFNSKPTMQCTTLQVDHDFSDTKNVEEFVISNSMVSEDEEQCTINSRRSVGSKLSADSAYSSLNRRSPHHAGHIVENVEPAVADKEQCHLISSSSSESSLPPLCTVQVAKYEGRSPSLTPTPPLVSQTSPVQQTLPKISKFCHECGSKYPVSMAKFCCQCGARRLVI